MPNFDYSMYYFMHYTQIRNVLECSVYATANFVVLIIIHSGNRIIIIIIITLITAVVIT